jgi:hypothetical protein
VDGSFFSDFNYPMIGIPKYALFAVVATEILLKKKFATEIQAFPYVAVVEAINWYILQSQIICLTNFFLRTIRIKFRPMISTPGFQQVILVLHLPRHRTSIKTVSFERLAPTYHNWNQTHNIRIIISYYTDCWHVIVVCD